MVKSGRGLIPSQGTKIPYALQYSQKKIIIIIKESQGDRRKLGGIGGKYHSHI